MHKNTMRKLFISTVVGLSTLMALPARAIIIPPRADTTVSTAAGESGTNFGANEVMTVDTSTRRILVKFENLGLFLPPGTLSSDIKKVNYHFYVHSTPSAGAKMLIPTLVTAPNWSEVGVTGSTALTEGATFGPSSVVFDGSHWAYIDVTDILKYWLDNAPVTVRSFVLKADTGTLEID
ncbi:MAG: DUF7594 domain-containing protein, partial [Methylococcales bacterium]